MCASTAQLRSCWVLSLASAGVAQTRLLRWYTVIALGHGYCVDTVIALKHSYCIEARLLHWSTLIALHGYWPHGYCIGTVIALHG